MVERTMPIKLRSQPEEKQISQLIASARQDPRKFGDLYLMYAQPIFRYLYSRIRNIPVAEDATAQTFLAALEQIQKNTIDISRVGFSQLLVIRRWIISVNKGKRRLLMRLIFFLQMPTLLPAGPWFVSDCNLQTKTGCST